MKKTIFWSGLLLATAFGGPIGLFQGSNYWDSLKKGTSEKTTTSVTPVSEEPLALGGTPFSSNSQESGGSPKLALESTPLVGLDQVFRFDLSPADVLQRWPRVSTELPTLHLHGYRVPLVSGTSETDVAGALTYYFNPSQQVQRITFRGTTGDPRLLVTLLTSRYGYARRPNNDPSRFVFESVNSAHQMVGQVLIRSVPVVKASDPLRRFDIDLSMERPE